MRVLVIDDDEALRFWLKRELEPLGFDLSESANGDEALSVYKTAKFGFVLSDYQFLPGRKIKNGADLVIAIHKINREQRMALHTSVSSAVIRSKLPIDLRNIAVLKKPYPIRQLIELMKCDQT